jgi:hypothetical protein
MQKMTLVAVGLVLLAAGGAIGWFAANRDELARSGPTFHYRAGSPDLLAPAPAWEEWKYPGSRVHNSSTGSNVTHGDITVGNADRITLLTPDDFDKVWAFYKQMTITLFDDVRAHSFEGPGHEAVQARAFSVQSLRYSLVGFVYRPRGDATRVQLVYRPNTEFIGLLRERVKE